MSGRVGPKTQFFSYNIDLPLLPATFYLIEWQDSDGLNISQTYATGKFPITVNIGCATYGTIYINETLVFAINEPCPGNTICNQSTITTNLGTC